MPQENESEGDDVDADDVDEAAARDTAPPRPPWWRQAVRSFLELFALAGLAITQPVLDVFGDAPDFFVFRGAQGVDLVVFAVLVAVVPALALWAVEQVVGLAGARPRRIVHLGFLGVLVVLFGLGALKQADLASGVVVVALAVSAAVLAVLAYRRWEAVRYWVRVLAVAPILFVGLFLTTSPASDLLASQDVAAVEIAPVAHPHTVVMLQFDEWPLRTVVNADGQIDPQLYPNLAALAGDGVWYRNATTAATFTTYAVPAILTGREPDGDKSPVASQYPENLFTLLAGQYDLDVIEAITRLCPTNLCDGKLIDQHGSSATTVAGVDTTEEDTADQGGTPDADMAQLLTDARQTFQAMVSPDPDAAAPAQTFQETVTSATTAPTTTTTTVAQGPSPEQAAEAATHSTTTTAGAGGGPPGLPGGLGGMFAGAPVLSVDSVNDLVGSIEPGEDPTLHFLHVLLPHTPYKFLPDGRQYADAAGGLGAMSAIMGTRSDEQAEVNLDEQRLLLQASYTDSVVGQVVHKLKQAGLYDDAIVVVAADHGIGLTPGGIIRATLGGEGLPRDNYADLLYVPLVIKAPGLGEPGTVSDRNAQTIDILPTIADHLGIDLPWAVDGIPLGSEARQTPAKQFHVVTFAGGTGGMSLSVGPSVTFNGPRVQSEMLDRNLDVLLRDDNPDHRLYDIDDAGEIVGQQVDDLATAPADGATATLDDAGAFDDVDLSGGQLPTLLEGHLDAAGTDDLTIAVAVNGTVAAVTPTWPTDDQPHHLGAMVDPTTFRDGRNQVELFVVGGREGHRTLAPVAPSG